MKGRRVPRKPSTVEEQLSSDTTARLFAFTNYADGYKPVFSPKAPLMVLRAKQAKPGDSHPAAQWEPLAAAVYQLGQSPHAVYVVDGSLLGDSAETDENTTPFAMGRLLRPMAKAIVKLNPSKAVLVAAGPTARLGIKMLAASFTGANDFVGALALVQPPPPDVDLDRLVARGVAGAFELLVLAKDAAGKAAWESWAGGRKLFASIRAVVMVPGESLFATLARLVEDATAAATTGGLRAARVTPYQIKFIRSPYTNQVDQEIEIASLDTVVGQQADGAGSEDDEIESDDGEESDAGDAAAASNDAGPRGSATAVLRCHPAEFIHVGGERAVQVHGIMLDGARIGNAYGIVAFRRDDAEATAVAQHYINAPVTFTATVEFVDGCLCYGNPRNITVVAAAKSKYGALFCAVDAIPRVNHSVPRRFFGCVVMRGRKCALVRSLTNAYPGLRFPIAPLAGHRSATETAIAATCAQLDVSRDNFSIRTDIAPVVYYPPNSTDVVTLYPAFATFLPPGGAARDQYEEEENADDPYDWFTAAQATAKLRTAAEQEAISTMVAAVKRAASHVSAFSAPLPGLGTFGDAAKLPDTLVCFVLAPGASGLAETIDIAKAIAAAGGIDGAAATASSSSCVIELPDGACPSRKRKATVKAIGAAFEGGERKIAFVPVHPAAELDLVLYELAPDISDKLWAPTRLLTVFDGARVPHEPSSLAMLDGATSGATVVSAACDALEQCDIALLLEGPRWSQVDLIALCKGINRSAALCHTIAEARQHVDAVLRPHASAPLEYVSVASVDHAKKAAEMASATVAVLQFDQTGLSAVPFFTPRIEELLLANSDRCVAVLREAGVFHLTGHTWLCTQPQRQAEWRLVGGRLRLTRGPQWASVPGHALRVVAIAQSAESPLTQVVARVEALVQSLLCHSPDEAAVAADTLNWVDGEDDDDEAD